MRHHVHNRNVEYRVTIADAAGNAEKVVDVRFVSKTSQTRCERMMATLREARDLAESEVLRVVRHQARVERVAEQSLSIYAVDKGYMDDVPVAKIGAFEAAMQAHFANTRGDTRAPFPRASAKHRKRRADLC